MVQAQHGRREHAKQPVRHTRGKSKAAAALLWRTWARKHSGVAACYLHTKKRLQAGGRAGRREGRGLAGRSARPAPVATEQHEEPVPAWS